MNITLPDVAREYVVEYIERDLVDLNPYTCDVSTAHRFARKFWEFLTTFYRNVPSTKHGLRELIKIILLSNTKGNIPAIFLQNIPTEPADSFLVPGKTRGFDYAHNPFDRMKKYYYSEWCSWLIACVLNHDATIHPSEHGGNNRFHLISPIPGADKKLRNIGASTGGGKFFQHSDATVFTDLSTIEDIRERLYHCNTTIESVCVATNKPVDQIVAEITCRKFARVDATLLKGVLNLNTKTNIATPRMLQKSLQDDGFSKRDLVRLSRMPIAHIAGPADGAISGYIGEIAPPIIFDGKRLIGTCINSAETRMVYVGESSDDANLFSKFITNVRNMDTISFLLTGTDLLFIPNACYLDQTNYTHGRERLGGNEYNIPIAGGQFSRRMHCRLYAKSFRRDNEASILSGLV
ncbi:MAG: hypothetical protein OXU62_12830 [Gammaproteobacteria bacterium]|nr:hypothetical protein [Gammaproteobacteria bacterium]